MSIRVLIVDDSAVVRQMLQRVLEPVEGIEVVGAAPDPYVARDLIVELEPDVVTLDVEMPRMDGISFLRRLMVHRPIPVIVLSSLTPAGGALALEAFAAGAVEVLAKPGTAYSIGELGPDLVRALRTAAVARVEKRVASTISAPNASPLARTTDRIICFGTSTGGVEALREVLPVMPPDAPGILVVQHMPAKFTSSLANSLNKICSMTVRQATHGETLTSGKVLIAPGDSHLLVRRSGGRYVAGLKEGPLVNRHRPAVDVLFESAAESAGSNAVGVIMTGMGRDGAAGLKAMREAGAWTIAQDEKTSIVYGMPRAAAELDAASEVRPLNKIAKAALDAAFRDEPSGVKA